VPLLSERGSNTFARVSHGRTTRAYSENIIYTKSAGCLEGKDAAMCVVTSAKEEESEVTVETKHGMSAAHYIVRHVVISEAASAGAKTFSSDDKPVSTYEIKVTPWQDTERVCDVILQPARSVLATRSSNVACLCVRNVRRRRSSRLAAASSAVASSGCGRPRNTLVPHWRNS